MKSRFFKTLLLAVVIVAGIWILSNRDKIREPGDVVDLVRHQLSTSQNQLESQIQDLRSSDSKTHLDQVPIEQSRYQLPENRKSPEFVTNVIRIASFKLSESIAKPDSGAALELLADICRRYDAVAFQDISIGEFDWLAQLTDHMNTAGSADTSSAIGNRNQSGYSCISDRSKGLQGPLPSGSTRAAIVFNRRTLELDQSQWYSINDPDEILSREPLVACFRARGPAADQAFTFSLVNVKIDGQRPEQELANLEELFRAIRNDGRGEDDVLIVGDFHAGDRELHPMRKRAGWTWVVSNRPTTTLETSQFDNLVFNEAATVEFTGRGGVFDFMRHYNLRLDDALRISEHMPVWAEFSVFEGAVTMEPRNISQITPGRVADGELPTQR